MVVGPADDRHEREADAVAERVVRRAFSPTIEAATTRIRATDHPIAGVAGRPTAPAGRIMRAAPLGAAGGELDDATTSSLHAARRGGSPLAPALQDRYGAAFGADLSAVRLHTDARADSLSRTMGAVAFTTGHDIFFRAGEHRDTAAGHRLLAHELTHVVQQEGAGPVQRVQRKVPKSAHPGDPEEFNRIENRPAGTPHKDQGIASQPVNYHAPGFTIVVKPGKRRFSAKVVPTGKASIGDSEATYLAPGMHDSGFFWASDPLYDGHPVSNRMLMPNQAGPHDDEHVVFNITGAVAKQSKAAEQEHLDDYRYAYRLSLQAAQDAIKSVAKRRFKHANAIQWDPLESTCRHASLSIL